MAADRGLDVAELSARTDRKLDHAPAFRDAYAAYCRPTDGLDGVTLAPFQILAAEGRVAAVTEPHAWHLEQLALLRGRGDHPDPAPVRRPGVRRAAGRGRRVVGGAHRRGRRGHGGQAGADPADARVQPGLKVRGREYLRIIYGPDYTDSLDVLRQRHLGKKRDAGPARARPRARRAHGFVEGAPLWRVHQLVFAVLALESEPVDPRL